MALHLAADEEDYRCEGDNTSVHIATDSLTSIYQIHRMLARPQDMTEHRHHTLLKAITELIAASKAGVVHIWKVKSHTGIVGNEIADTLAVAVSKDQTTSLSYNISEFNCECQQSNNREDMYWLYKEEERPPPPPNKAAAGGGREHAPPPTPDLIPVPLPNMAESLKAQIHDHCKLGQSNQQSVYFSSWQRMHRQIHHKHSHLFLTSSTVKPRLRKLVLQYRYGHLPTNKLLKRYRQV